MTDPTKNISMISAEYTAAVKKHPKFCDMFTGFDLKTANELEMKLKFLNSQGPYQADCILHEEIWEATTAYLKGDKEHCLQELAQCGAVILRMMEFVQNEINNKQTHNQKEQ